MQSDTRTALYFILLILSVIGLFMFLLMYPFVQEPRTMLTENIILEHGTYDAATGKARIVQLHADGTVFELDEDSKVSTISAEQLQAIIDAIDAEQYEKDRSSQWDRFAQTRCQDCVTTWTLIQKEDSTLRVTNLESLRPIASVLANI